MLTRVRFVLGLSLALTACASRAPAPGIADGGDGSPSNPVEGGSDTGAPTSADAGALVAIALTACIPNVYSAAIRIGGLHDYDLLLDTGSATLAVAAAGCASCADAGVSSLYEPGPTAVDQQVAADSLFGNSPADQSGFSGEIYQDWVGTGASPELAKVKLVAIANQAQFLVGTCGSSGVPQGVIGFAPSSSAVAGTNVFFDQVVAAGVVPDVFATRLCSGEGTLWLGGYDPTFATAPPSYTPMLSGQGGFYSVDLASISVSGMTIPVPMGSYTGAMLDTGASNSTLPPAAFSALTSAIAASPAFSSIFGASAAALFSSNASVHLSQTREALDAALPALTLTFGSSPAISVQAAATESYLLTYGGGEWSSALTALAPSTRFPGIAAHLGAPLLASNVVIFDRARKRVGFAPHAPCP